MIEDAPRLKGKRTQGHGLRLFESPLKTPRWTLHLRQPVRASDMRTAVRNNSTLFPKYSDGIFCCRDEANEWQVVGKD